MPDPAPPTRRVALVIGIGTYEVARKLVAPPGDAARMARLLQSLGFTVLPALNSDFNDLRQSLRQFYEQLRGADVGLLYFSGHGVQDATRENYLLPADADLHEPEDLGRFCFSLRRIMSDMTERVETGLIFLDACRDNPFDGEDAPRTKSVLASGGGLSRPKGSLSGLLVAYASDEGQVALDGSGDAPSPFTDALLRHLPAPGRPITSALIDVCNDVQAATKGRQTPWTQASLKREVVLVPGKDTAPPPLPPPPPVKPTPQPEPPPVGGSSQKTGVSRNGMTMALVPVLLAALGLGGFVAYRSGQTDADTPIFWDSDTPTDPDPEPKPDPGRSSSCEGLSFALEMACRAPDLASDDETTRLTTAKEMEHALGDVSTSTADKAQIVAALLELADPLAMAKISQDGRFNVLARLSSLPQDLWLDPALLPQLEVAHRTIAGLDEDTSGLLGNQTQDLLARWGAETGFVPRSKLTVYPHFAGYTREEFSKVARALNKGWGWTLQALDEEAGAKGIAQVRYGTDTMRPLALLMVAQLNGQIAPATGDASADRTLQKTLKETKLRRVEVAKVRGIRDNNLEIWIGK